MTISADRAADAIIADAQHTTSMQAHNQLKGLATGLRAGREIVIIDGKLTTQSPMVRMFKETLCLQAEQDFHKIDVELAALGRHSNKIVRLGKSDQKLLQAIGFESSLVFDPKNTLVKHEREANAANAEAKRHFKAVMAGAE